MWGIRGYFRGGARRFTEEGFRGFFRGAAEGFKEEYDQPQSPTDFPKRPRRTEKKGNHRR